MRTNIIQLPSLVAHTDVTCECQRFDCSGETLGQRLGSMARPERSENLPQASQKIEAGIGNCLARRFPILLRFFTKAFFGKVFFSESECRTCGARAGLKFWSQPSFRSDFRSLRLLNSQRSGHLKSSPNATRD